MLWRRLFILSGVISPLISSNILGTYQPGEFIFQCPIFLPFNLFPGGAATCIDLGWTTASSSNYVDSCCGLYHISQSCFDSNAYDPKYSSPQMLQKPFSICTMSSQYHHLPIPPLAPSHGFWRSKLQRKKEKYFRKILGKMIGHLISQDLAQMCEGTKHLI